MAALPKKKMAKTRSRKRKGALRVKIPELVKCSNCSKKILPHIVCPYCGFYKGKEVIKKEAKTKVTRV